VLTGETTIKLLTDNGIDPAQCGEGSCHLDTAKQMNVEKFISGTVQHFEGVYTASIRLIDTKTGNILASVRVESETVRGLSKEFAARSADFFAHSGLLRRDHGSQGPAARGGGQEGHIGGGAQDVTMGEDEVLIQFESEPKGAVVLLDGSVFCQATPCAKTVSPGTHEVQMQREGFETKTAGLQAKTGASVSLKLPRISALIWVETDPRGISAAVSLDGKSIGQTPIASREVVAGTHEIMIDDPCWQREGERVVVKRGEERTVRITLKPKLAGLKVTAEDGQGNAVTGHAFVDGRELGEVRGAASFKTPVCTRHLEVQAGELSFEAPLQLKAGEVTTVRAKLEPTARAEPIGTPVAREARDDDHWRFALRAGVGGAVGVLGVGAELRLNDYFGLLGSLGYIDTPVFGGGVAFRPLGGQWFVDLTEMITRKDTSSSVCVTEPCPAGDFYTSLTTGYDFRIGRYFTIKLGAGAIYRRYTYSAASPSFGKFAPFADLAVGLMF
jgi:hypothetical protein